MCVPCTPRREYSAHLFLIRNSAEGKRRARGPRVARRISDAPPSPLGRRFCREKSEVARKERVRERDTVNKKSDVALDSPRPRDGSRWTDRESGGEEARLETRVAEIFINGQLIKNDRHFFLMIIRPEMTIFCCYLVGASFDGPVK